MEGALQQGAGYNNAFTYGILSGATEAAMEKLGGYAFGDATSLLGKATAGTKFGAWASKGLGKAITGAVSEGVEELGSDFTDPVNKWITGVDTEIGANFRAAVKNIPRTFAMGATVGTLMQGGQVLGQNISNKEAGRGGAKATRADSSLAYVSESAQNYGKNEAQNRKTDKAILQGLTDVGVQMTQMSESERAVYRESLGEYKNVFNEDGSIKQDIEIADVNTEAISRKLKPISLTLKHAPIDSSVEIKDGARQAKAHIEKVLGSKANVVITSDSKETNAYFSPDENVFYINNNSATLNDADGAIKKASLQVSFHEMTHSAEGTHQYNEFVNELYRVAMDENAPDSVKKRVGSLFGRELGAIQDYAEQTKGMSKAQARYTVDTEVIADLSGDLMADDYIVNKLAERNAPLLKKLISRFKGTIKKSATVDSESIKYLKKLVNRFEKALDNARGGVKISQIGNADDEREETADSSQQTADSKSNRNKQPTQEDIEQGKKLVEFINAVKQMQNKSIISKRKHRIGFISKEHAQFTESLLEEIGIDIDLDGYELWIDGTGAEHVEIRHGEKGKADSTMSEEVLKEKIPWAVNYADSGTIMRKDNGDIKYSNRFQNSDGSRSPELKMYKKIDGETLCVSECVTDSKYRRIYITSAYIIKKDSSGQVLNMDENTSPQLTSKMVSDSTATDNSITEKSQKDNSFDKNNSKNVSDERKSVKRSYEPGGESSKKITLGMSDAERTEILKNTVISVEPLKNIYEFDSDIVEGLQNNRKSYVEKTVVKKLRDLGCLKKYETDVVDVAFEFTGKGLNKSMNSQVSDYGGNLEDLANVVLNLQQLLDTSVLIEIHNDKKAKDLNKTRLQNVFVLFSTYRGTKGITPVQFEIKQFIDNQNRLYLAVALTKIETGVMGDTVLDNEGRTRLLPVSSISISQLIEKINPADANFFKYIPDEMLSQEQISAKKTALAKEAKKYGINSDERKSVKRSYEPGKESEFEETLHDKYDNAGQEKTSEKQKGKKKSQYTAKGTIKNLNIQRRVQ